MDFIVPQEIVSGEKRYKDFLEQHMVPHLDSWYQEGMVPRSFFLALGKGGWLGFDTQNGRIAEQSAIQHAVMFESLSSLSPGIAVAVLVHISLGTLGIHLFGSEKQKEAYLGRAVRGESLICLGNTEPTAGSDVANVAMRAEKAEGGWVLNGTKAYATNGTLSDLAIVTAVTSPEAPRNKRMSMFIVDLSAEGVSRKKLNKQVWIPSDLSRIQLKDVFIPQENLLGQQGRGLQQVLEIFTNSRLSISALTIGTALGAFELGMRHAGSRKIFGQKLLDFQAKSFEAADYYAKLEAARLTLWKACWTKDQGNDFRLEASIAKYLSVEIARAVSAWAADLFGAASVIQEHPIHKFPMDAWASSLGEGTQDVQKLIIFREVVKQMGV
ncbi:MAG: acyl-CoA dehydrogenase family protein [Desulfoferrobacter sp.]